MKKILFFFGTGLLGLASLGQSSAQTVLIENDFDSTTATDIGPTFQFFSNAVGGAGTVDLDSGSFTNSASATNSSGLNNTATVDVLTSDPAAVGFELEIVVDSVTNAAAIQSNGLFLGVVSGTSATQGGNLSGDAVSNGPALFNNLPAAIGLRIGGTGGAAANPNTAFAFVEDPLGGLNQNQVNINFPDPAAAPVLPDAASIEDGFTVTFAVDSANSFTVTTSGLSNDVTCSGTLTGTPDDGNVNATPGSTLFSAIQSDLGISISAQGAGVGVQIGSVTLTTIDTLVTVTPKNTGILGDANLDGVVNFFDIQPFIELLANQTFLFQADVDGNGTVDFFDIQPFINILAGG